MKRMFLILLMKQLLTIYKAFARSHQDLADKIYDKLFKDPLKEKLEKFWYSAAFIITGALKDTSQECLHKELGRESLSDGRCYCKLVFL